MDGRPAESPGERLRIAFELHDLAVQMLKQGYHRRHPEAGDSEVEAAVLEWHARRPGAEDGDCVGRRIAWPPAR